MTAAPPADDIGCDRLAILKAGQTGDRADRSEILQALAAKYVRTPRDVLLANEIDRIVDRALMARNPKLPFGPGNRREAVGLALVGATGAGKSKALEKLFNSHPALPNYGDLDGGCPIVSVTCPSPATLKTLGRAILRALGYEISADIREHIVWERVRKQLLLQRLPILHIDEMQHVLRRCNANQTGILADTMKSLLQSTEWPVCLVLSGLHDLLEFFYVDGQVRRRFHFVSFTSISVEADRDFLRTTITHYAELANLTLSAKPEDDLEDRLCHAADYQLGTAIETVINAIEVALLENASGLARTHFANAYETRTGSAPAANPFILKDWTRIDTARVLAKDIEPTETDLPPTRKKRRSR